MEDRNPYAPPQAEIFVPRSERPAGEPLASRWSRLGGFLVDRIFEFLIAGVLGMVFFHNFLASIRTGVGSRNFRLFVALAPVAVWAVLNARLLHQRGQTIGKFATGTRIVRRDGLPTDFWYLFARRSLPILLFQYAVWILSGYFPSHAKSWNQFAFWIVVGSYLLIFRKSRACLHDDLAATRVISIRPRPGAAWD